MKWPTESCWCISDFSTTGDVTRLARSFRSLRLCATRLRRVFEVFCKAIAHNAIIQSAIALLAIKA
ncbi:hypothetical protein [Nostoc sp. PA-18-2419]|uniref:hypothetical protein n=1 Tax=Nostoc sp. PA-18-2419 TaxID=2575443 RepID=UPI001108184A|nr:hypothetical protein [Nostoc sp. PA-18-2419]